MSPKVSEAYKQEKKKELLQAAKQVFIRKGYTNATMQEVMDEARVSRGALYAYFHHIDHVFMEVLRLDDQHDILFFETDGELSLWSQLTNWIKQQKKYIEGSRESLLRAKVEFFLTSKYAQDNTNSLYITERYDKLQKAIREFIQKGIEQDEFDPVLAPEDIALYFVSFIDGLLLNTFQLGPNKTKVQAQLTAFQFSLKRMLLPTEET